MKLSIEEKVNLLDGLDVWHTKPIGGLPSLMMADGPHGVRKQIESKDNLGVLGSEPATCFPTASLTACSFDRDLMRQLGKLIAKEAQSKEVHIILGPGINIKRSPLCGRNFEYFSEDPYLTGELAASFVRAVEDEEVGTSVKHFFANNQEKNRFVIDSIVDQRALHEIYLRAFERVVKENPATVMASYNKINGFYATEHPYISKILRKDWGFKGVVVSDWGAIHNRIDSIKAGTDLEMPSSMGYRAKQVLEAVSKDEALRQAITKSSDRIIDLVKKYKNIPNVDFDFNTHHKEAIRIASESMVLLKNQKVLPIKKQDKVLMVGGFIDSMRFQGGGSSHINPTQKIQIVDIAHQYTQQVKFAKGFHLDHDKIDEDLILETLNLAKEVDKVILFIGLPEKDETEGFDRKTLDIPKNQIDLLNKLIEVNSKVITVIITGSVVNLSFESKVKGILLAYLGGQGSSEAMLDLLFGKVCPSGRLAETFIDDIKACNVILTDDNHSVHYEESIFVGYRYYQTFNKEVRFPFGYGLSYTKFDYQTILVSEEKDEFIIDITLKNSGNIKGKEVIQIYIENNESTVYKARRELKAFEKIEMDPLETKNIQIKLSKKAFEYYDVYKKDWVIEKGKYQIIVAKNVLEEIDTFEVELEGEEIHQPALSYQKYVYDCTEFNKICQRKLPEKSIIRKRPYTLSSTLEDAKNTLIGRIVTKIIIKEGMKQTQKMNDLWMKEVALKTMMETPIHMLALFSSGEFTFMQAEGLVDVMNLKLIKGIRKLRKGAKK